MLPVGPGAYGFLLLHITPHVNFGTAIIQYAVWCDTNPVDIDTLTYILSSNANSAVSEIDKNDFNIYPNPAKEKVNIISSHSSGFNFSIFDFTGNKIATGNSDSDTFTFFTGDLKNGIYNISIEARNSSIIKKNFVIIK
jgi:hypothetical protein